MAGSKKIWMVFPLVLALGFAAGLLVAPNPGFAPEKGKQAKTQPPAKTTPTPQAREVINELSQAFEEASARISSNAFLAPLPSRSKSGRNGAWDRE